MIPVLTQGERRGIVAVWPQASFSYVLGQYAPTLTAVAVAVADKVPAEGPVVILSTAHPAKFPDAVERATGRIPPLPPALSDLHARRENFSSLPADLGLVRDFIAARVPTS